MKKITINISASSDHFGAYDENGIGIYAAGDTVAETKKDVYNTIEILKELDSVPDILKGEYEIVYKFDIVSLLAYYKGLFTLRGLSKLIGINEDLLYQYATGMKSPREKQRKKIEKSLHKLGNDLLAVEL